ncbi:MAG: glycoside hydrolase family 3 N-terminal domain-containing protein [Calditrichia bacterium]
MQIRLILIILTFALVLNGFSSRNETALNRKVEEIISSMTPEEKVGQMTQITLQAISAQQGTVNQMHQLDPAKMREAVTRYQVGSIINVYDKAHTLDQWHHVINSIQKLATEETRLGIPVLYGIDAIHGANYTVGATIFPQSIGMAATWNPDLVKSEGDITAFEVRASGIPWNFNPVLGVGRHPLWPRLFETYGEDPFLTATMGAAYIKGLEGNNNDISQPDKVASCMKHYLGYSFPLSGKDRTPAWIPERMMREIFLPPFRAAVKSGIHTVMLNSSEINGVPVHADPYLLTEVLRNELGFQGVIVTDWHDIINLYEREKIAESRKEAVRMSVMAGVDMSMVPYDFSFYDDLLELVQEGVIPESRLDESVRRILKLKLELGLFDRPFADASMKEKVGSAESQQVALQAARESLTLLKNENNILPLKKGMHLLVTGPTAASLARLNSGWTFTWQGNEESLYPAEKMTILEAVTEKAGSSNIKYAAGSDYDKTVDIDAAVAAAGQADAVLLCLGENAYCETPGNIDDLTLPQAQVDLAQALIGTGKPVVLVLAEGRPRLISRFADEVDAILMAYLPGLEGGPAIADVLFGDYNPSGKLPITYPRYAHALGNYDYKTSEATAPNQHNPQFPFGHGLSYTTFVYSNLKLDKTSFKNGDSLLVSVQVKNTGQREGREVVQVYVSDLVRSVTPPVRQLKGFSGVILKPGEEKTVHFTLTGKDLEYIGVNNKPVIEPGDFKIAVAGLSAYFRLLD